MPAVTAQTPAKIKVLPRELAEKIAAGEVIERPSSVVKELVENAIDAGATRIQVDLEEGGRKAIRIHDNGHGIADGDVLTALERHATSKINALDDLWNLSTMGFRGEALPSIATISRFTLETRADGGKGRKVYLEGGKLLKDERGAFDDAFSGTVLAVEDLFFNVPARLKFLKAKSSEAGQIREMIEHMALAHPHIHFLVYSEGRKSLDLRAAALEKRVSDIFETKPENLEYFESHFDNAHLRGWVDRDHRATNSKMTLVSVNRRIVRDKLLQQAVLVALRPRMMEGEYPKIYVELEVAPGDIDVNVHPTKSEVRFKKPRDMFQLIHGALERLALTPSKPFYSVQAPVRAQAYVRPEVQHGLGLESQAVYKQKVDLEEQRITTVDSMPLAESGMPKQSTVQHPEYRPQHTAHRFNADAGAGAGADASTNTQPTQSSTNTSPGFHSLHYIGQLKNTYLLFQDSDGLIVIDQHAAHERIQYEKLKTKFLADGLRSQPLLVAAAVKCKTEDLDLAVENVAFFLKMGFEVEAFGDNGILVRAAPEGLNDRQASDLFRALLEQLRENADDPKLLAGNPLSLSAKVERLVATAACHSSVRAGQSLSTTEARELALKMDGTSSSLNCPHGRPASIRLTFDQIEGMFKRG